MKSSIVGTTIAIIVLFVGLVIVPIYQLSLITWRDDLIKVQTETRNYIDKIIDTSTNPDNYVEDFNLALASCSNTFTYTLEHYARVTNPDGKGGTVTTWQVTNDLSNFSKGDIVKITVIQKSYNIFQKISQSLLGMNYVNKDIVMSAMVR